MVSETAVCGRCGKVYFPIVGHDCQADHYVATSANAFDMGWDITYYKEPEAVLSHYMPKKRNAHYTHRRGVKRV